MTVRMDNIGIVVEDLDATIAFFEALGLVVDGRTAIDDPWAGRVTGLADQRVDIAMMKTPGGEVSLELSRFRAPDVVEDHRGAPVNALGYLRVMFEVEDLDGVLATLREHGAELVGDVVSYANVYRLCYVRGPESILLGLAERIR
ncbi:MAG: VOC family protein [Microbacterium sp.]|nr:VOC family protein [Microbacterium sp.]